MNKWMIGIITYKGAHRVANLLESIKKFGGLGSRVPIVLVDDGSPDPLPAHQVVSQYDLSIVCHNENRGISAAWNTATRYLDSRYVCLLNDDILVAPNWLECMDFFLENNPVAGSVSWPFYFINGSVDVSLVLDSKGDPPRIPRDPITKEPCEDWTDGQINARPGSLMCPAGSCFAFSREMFDLAGGFDEEMRSFHEESHFGTTLAVLGHPSFGLPFPMLYHIWSATFSASPELKAHERMVHSRALYCKHWNVPPEFHENPFEYTHPLVMGQINPTQVTWLRPDLQVEEDVVSHH